MRLLFAGDFYNEDKYVKITDDNVLNSAKSSDAFIANFEGPLDSNSKKQIKKVGPLLSQSHSSIKILKEMGITHLSLANNHVLDYGDNSFIESVQTLKKDGYKVFGYKTQDEDYTVTRIGKVSIIAVAEQEFNLSEKIGSPLIDEIDLWNHVEKEKKIGNKVIVIMHGGVEEEHIPPPWLRKLSHWLIDIGVSAVVNHHQHVPGTVETYKGKPIAWSLGNFWFSRFGKTRYWYQFGYVFVLDISDDISWKTYSYFSDYEENEIRALDKAQQSSWDKKMKEIKDIMSDDSRYKDWWNSVISKKSRGYIVRYSMGSLPSYLASALERIPSSKRWMLRQLNGLRCRSHRELWIRSLDKNEKN